VPAPEAGFVVDCSVSAAWLFEEQADDYTEAALDALASAPALAPGSWILEMLNVLLMLERRRAPSSCTLSPRATSSPVTTRSISTWP
jgi:predicted nucleic acid-binding protein